MIFIWGKKVVRHSLGYVADLCPVCRELTRFEVRRIGMASHFYYIPFGEGALLGHERTCSECRIVLNARPETYKTIARERRPAQELVATTKPDWREFHAQRLALELDVATAPDRLPADLRKALIREPFQLLDPIVEAYYAKVSFDGRAWAAVAFLILLLFFAAKLSNMYPSQFEVFYGTAFAVGFALIAWQAIGARKRFLEKKVYPVLLRSLRALRPTALELEGVVAEMKAGGRKIGQKLSVAAFTRWTNASPGSSGLLSGVDDVEHSQAGT